jgi:hypothetical protein
VKSGHKIAVHGLDDALTLALVRCADVAHALVGESREMNPYVAQALVETISAVRLAMFEAENLESYGTEAERETVRQ